MRCSIKGWCDCRLVMAFAWIRDIGRYHGGYGELLVQMNVEDALRTSPACSAWLRAEEWIPAIAGGLREAGGLAVGQASHGSVRLPDLARERGYLPGKGCK